MTPGLGAAGHIRRFSKRLINDDFPTFGYPTMPARTYATLAYISSVPAISEKSKANHCYTTTSQLETLEIYLKHIRYLTQSCLFIFSVWNWVSPGIEYHMKVKIRRHSKKILISAILVRNGPIHLTQPHEELHMQFHNQWNAMRPMTNKPAIELIYNQWISENKKVSDNGSHG